MKTSRLLLWLLLLALVSVDGAALAMAAAGGSELRWPHPTLGAILGLPFSQVSLVGVWAAFGTRTAPWRLAGALVIVVIWSMSLAATLQDEVIVGYTATRWVALLLAQTLVILGPLSIFRAAGVRLARAADVDSTPNRLASRPRFQFSLGYLLAWMTAVGVVLGMLQWSVHLELLPRTPSAWLETGILSLSHGGIALSTLWILLGTWRPTLQIAMLWLFTILFVGVCFILGRDTSFHSALAVLLLTETLLLVCSLSVLRVAGYRLGRQGTH